MKIKKWLAGAVLSLCLLMNTLAMPAASAGTLGDMVAERFPSISALQEKLGNKDSLRESLQYLENWQEYVDKGIEKLNELNGLCDVTPDAGELTDNSGNDENKTAVKDISGQPRSAARKSSWTNARQR